MSKLTTKERNEIYKLALFALEEAINKNLLGRGLCWFIMVAAEQLEFWEANPFYYGFASYPEIQKHEPKEHGCYWWDIQELGIQKRIEILKQAIAETN